MRLIRNFSEFKVGMRFKISVDKYELQRGWTFLSPPSDIPMHINKDNWEQFTFTVTSCNSSIIHTEVLYMSDNGTRRFDDEMESRDFNMLTFQASVNIMIVESKFGLPKDCTCSGWTLLHLGCQCGFIKNNEKKEEKKFEGTIIKGWPFGNPFGMP